MTGESGQGSENKNKVRDCSSRSRSLPFHGLGIIFLIAAAFVYFAGQKCPYCGVRGTTVFLRSELVNSECAYGIEVDRRIVTIKVGRKTYGGKITDPDVGPAKNYLQSKVGDKLVVTHEP